MDAVDRKNKLLELAAKRKAEAAAIFDDDEDEDKAPLSKARPVLAERPAEANVKPVAVKPSKSMPSSKSDDISSFVVNTDGEEEEEEEEEVAVSKHKKASKSSSKSSKSSKSAKPSKGKKQKKRHDSSSDDDSDAGSDVDAAAGSDGEGGLLDELEGLDTTNIITGGRRTRGKQIDFKSLNDSDDDDEDESD